MAADVQIERGIKKRLKVRATQQKPRGELERRDRETVVFGRPFFLFAAVFAHCLVLALELFQGPSRQKSHSPSCSELSLSSYFSSFLPVRGSLGSYFWALDKPQWADSLPFRSGGSRLITLCPTTPSFGSATEMGSQFVVVMFASRPPNPARAIRAPLPSAHRPHSRASRVKKSQKMQREGSRRQGSLEDAPVPLPRASENIQVA